MKFILTKELGRLAKWLRILGFDAEYFTEENTGSLIIQALRDSRVILTRNQRLAKPSGVKIVLIKAEKVREQIKEFLTDFNLEPDARLMFRRCILCNAELEKIAKEKVKAQVPEYVFKTQEEFFTCPQCKRVYWQGTHWGNVEKILQEIVK